MALPTPEAAKETRKFIAQAGGNSTWDRLAEYLEKGSSGKEKFVINRTFDAPIELMFEMWTDPEHFSQWIAPIGMQMEFIRANITPGGKTFSCMPGNNIKMYAGTHYLEINKPHHVVYTQQFLDENEKISRHPFVPVWPETMLTTVTLTPEGPDQTRVTVEWEPYGDTTPEEIAIFINVRTSMTQGWTGSFDKLEAYLAKLV